MAKFESFPLTSKSAVSLMPLLVLATRLLGSTVAPLYISTKNSPLSLIAPGVWMFEIRSWPAGWEVRRETFWQAVKVILALGLSWRFISYWLAGRTTWPVFCGDRNPKPLTELTA